MTVDDRSQAESQDPSAGGARPSQVNLPNALTALRIVMIPFFVWLLMRNNGAVSADRVAALVVFIAAMVTDAFDGAIARSRGLVTAFGQIADPIADKALTGAAFVCLSLLGTVPWWATAAIMVREIGITALRFVVIRHGVMPANRGGKFKTVLQSVTLGLYIAPMPAGAEDVIRWLLWATVVVTVATGIDYIAQAARLRRTSARTAAKRARRGAA